MDDQLQRIAVAEELGWTECRAGGVFGSVGRKPTGGGSFTGAVRLPDYLNDLNACHEMEKALNKKQRKAMWGYLLKIMGDDATEMIWHATERQRVEAFLRTVGRWVDK